MGRCGLRHPCPTGPAEGGGQETPHRSSTQQTSPGTAAQAQTLQPPHRAPTSQVETTFATLKRRMRLTCIRYVGLIKATGQVVLASIAFNMRRWATIAA
ncbi:transposase [Bradyrhizobium sp. LA2.1]|uniref:transposase n=1 Tax=Bradyrhizobium sp. LA2.1 TaxID=3156376 RepID=UPI0033951636